MLKRRLLPKHPAIIIVNIKLKGEHQKNIYCLNLILWMARGCGIALFGLSGLRTF